MENLGRISDERLFIRYAEGDGGAFRVLMDRYAVRLLHYCRGLVASEQEAEDLVQETFLRAIRSAGTYRATSRFSTWIYTIARNLCLDRLKAERKRGALRNDREKSIAESTIGGHLESTAIPSENCVRTLSNALEKLTPLEAETIRLTFYEDWTSAQIANLQNCSRATVRVRRHQALGKLRKVLGTQGQWMSSKVDSERNRNLNE